MVPRGMEVKIAAQPAFHDLSSDSGCWTFAVNEIVADHFLLGYLRLLPLNLYRMYMDMAHVLSIVSVVVAACVISQTPMFRIPFVVPLWTK
jgi:hypothetical protein